MNNIDFTNQGNNTMSLEKQLKLTGESPLHPPPLLSTYPPKATISAGIISLIVLIAYLAISPNNFILLTLRYCLSQIVLHLRLYKIPTMTGAKEAARRVERAAKVTDGRIWFRTREQEARERYYRTFNYLSRHQDRAKHDRRDWGVVGGGQELGV